MPPDRMLQWKISATVAMACDKSPSSYSNLYLDRMALAKKMERNRPAKLWLMSMIAVAYFWEKHGVVVDDYNCMNALERDTGA